MPVQSSWFNKEDAILHTKYIDKWTGEEWKISEEKLLQLSDEVAGRFDIITDFKDSSSILPIGALQKWLYYAQRREVTCPNWGLTVFVTTSPTIRAYFEEGVALFSIIQKHCRLVHTVQDALQLINMHRKATEEDEQALTTD